MGGRDSSEEGREGKVELLKAGGEGRRKGLKGTKLVTSFSFISYLSRLRRGGRGKGIFRVEGRDGRGIKEQTLLIKSDLSLLYFFILAGVEGKGKPGGLRYWDVRRAEEGVGLRL